MSDTPPPAAPAPAPAGPPSGGTPPVSPPLVAKGEKTPREIELEIKLSKTEDTLDTLKKHLGETTKLLEGARTMPSPRQPGKKLIDDLEDFLGWPGESQPPANPT